MKQNIAMALVATTLLAACADPGTTRAATCPMTDLSRFAGQSVVDVAANEALPPIRLVQSGEAVAVEAPNRLTLRTDGRGRVVDALCG